MVIQDLQLRIATLANTIQLIIQDFVTQGYKRLQRGFKGIIKLANRNDCPNFTTSKKFNEILKGFKKTYIRN